MNGSPGSTGGIANLAAVLRCGRRDQARLIGSILAFDVRAGGGYQSWESRALRNWFLAHGLNIRPLGQTIYLMPPYCISDEELARTYAGIVACLDALASGALSNP